jgi:uncharacterized protein YjeT (DUF2065 family)
MSVVCGITPVCLEEGRHLMFLMHKAFDVLMLVSLEGLMYRIMPVNWYYLYSVLTELANCKRRIHSISSSTFSSQFTIARQAKRFPSNTTQYENN